MKNSLKLKILITLLIAQTSVFANWSVLTKPMTDNVQGITQKTSDILTGMASDNGKLFATEGNKYTNVNRMILDRLDEIKYLKSEQMTLLKSIAFKEKQIIYLRKNLALKKSKDEIKAQFIEKK